MRTLIIVVGLLHFADYTQNVPLTMDNESQAAYLNTCVHGLNDRIPPANKIKVCKCTLAKLQTMSIEDAVNSVQAAALNCALSK